MGASLNLNNKKARRSRSLISDINVTPLVDVMLVLLIIFMVTSPMLVTGINVNLPQSDADQLKSNEEPLSVSVDKHKNWYINETKIDKKELLPKIKAITKENFDTKIAVHGDEAVDYGQVAEILGALSSAGFGKITLTTKPYK